MLQNWDYLIAEIGVLLIIAALLGLVAGWLIFGGPRRAARGDDALLRTELENCRAAGAEQEARIAELEDKLATARDRA